MSELGLDPAAAGVYAVFAELMSGELTIAQQGTTVPWFPPDAEYEASRLAWVWPITQRPALAADDLVIDPALPDEFAAGGRLSRLLDAGSRLRVSWLIDTATVDTARVLADGYRVPGPDGPEPGEQTDGNVDVEDPAPVVVLGKPAAERWPENGTDHHPHPPHGHGRPVLLLRMGVKQDGLGERHQARAKNALQ